jgi:hypothetical protein
VYEDVLYRRPDDRISEKHPLADDFVPEIMRWLKVELTKPCPVAASHLGHGNQRAHDTEKNGLWVAMLLRILNLQSSSVHNISRGGFDSVNSPHPGSQSNTIFKPK